MGIFNMDGPIFRGLSRLADILILSALWFVSSIPLVTLGASTSALYFTIFKVLRNDEDTVWKCYWRSFASNFKQSLVSLPIIVAFGYWGLFLIQRLAVGDVLKFGPLLAFIAFSFCTMWLHYILSYIARFTDPIKAVLSKTLVLCISELPRSLILLILFLVFFCFAALLFLYVPIALFIIPVMYVWLASFTLEKVYRKYIPKPQEAEQTGDESID